MDDVGRRWARVADTFTARAEEVPDDRWGAPAPCAGWVARDVVRHLVGWVPQLLEAGTGRVLARGPSVDVDPVGAWRALDAGIRALLDDPAVAASTFSHPVAGTHRLDEAVGQFVLGDVLVHTWDLARAAGLDERLDPDEVAAMLAEVEPLDDVLRASGHYGPRVEVPVDAGPQDRLLGFLGRRP